MSVLLPASESAWFLDDDESDLQPLKGALLRRIPQLGVALFADVLKALHASHERPATSWILSTDTIGTGIMSTGRRYVHEYRKDNPLAIVVLHSRQAERDPEKVAQLRQEKAIDAFIPKSQRERLVDLIVACHRRWVSPVARKLRAYIATCPDPHTPYFPDGEGSFLSVIDEHRELVLGTELGQEAEAIWGKLLTDWVPGEPLPGVQTVS